MAASNLSSTANQLGNLLRSNIGEINWVEAVDQENKFREPRRTEITKDGVTTVTDYIDSEENGQMKKFKVVTTYKVVTKKVPRVVAERKKWKKFGQSANDGTGPNINTTYCADDVEIQFINNRFGEPDDLLLDDKRGMSKGQTAKGAHCRFCKSDDHWSVQCPYKDHFKESNEADESDNAEKPAGGKGGIQGGRYLPPSMREGGGERGTNIGSERPSDDTTVRITNLPEDSDTLDEDLRAMFQSAGRITRSYVARDNKSSGRSNKAKGFAFITFSMRQEAETAIQRFNGAKFEHMILKVEWTRQSN